MVQNCNCPCRNYSRFIQRAFTPNELNTEEIIPMTLETAMEELDGIQRYNYRIERYNTFAHCLRIHLAYPASVMQALETCRCCQRHQQNRSLVEWTIYNEPVQLPGVLSNDLTDSDYVSETDSETDYGPDSP